MDTLVEGCTSAVVVVVVVVVEDIDSVVEDRMVVRHSEQKNSLEV